MVREPPVTLSTCNGPATESTDPLLMLSEPWAAAERSLRMAVIGCGPIGNLHAQAIAGSRHAVLVGVCDVDRERREATARRFGTVGYEHVGRLLEREQLRAVTIATPDHLHVDATLAALEAGCHVFCEKPLATTLGEAQRMACAAADRGLHLGVDYNRRFAFGYRTAKRLHDQGSVGALQFALLRVTDRTPRAEVAQSLCHLHDAVDPSLRPDAMVRR